MATGRPGSGIRSRDWRMTGNSWDLNTMAFGRAWTLCGRRIISRSYGTPASRHGKHGCKIESADDSYRSFSREERSGFLFEKGGRRGGSGRRPRDAHRALAVQQRVISDWIQLRGSGWVVASQSRFSLSAGEDEERLWDATTHPLPRS